MAAVWQSLMIYLAAAMPFIEGKGAVLLAQFMHMPARLSYALSLAGSCTPVPLLLSSRWEIPLPSRDRLPDKLRQYVDRYGCWALLVTIAIPFTGMGCWLGALAARALELDRRRSALSIFVGNAVALLIMTGCLSGVFMLVDTLFGRG